MVLPKHLQSEVNAYKEKQRERQQQQQQPTPPGGDEEKPQEYGKGCRQRRQTTFYEDEFIAEELQREARRALKRNAERGTSSSEDETPMGRPIQFNKRYPEREAAKKAIAKIHKLVDSEEEEIPPHPRQRSSGGGHNRSNKKHKAESLDSSAVASSTDDSDSDQETSSSKDSDSSTGMVTERDAHNALAASKKQLPINQLMQNMLKDSVGHDHHHPHPAQREGKGKRGRDASEEVNVGRDKKGKNSGETNFTDPDLLGDITPLPIDPSVTFESVGGLPQHIITLREMVIIPLLYPNLLSQLGVTTPRGVLFVGPPGTGKTLLARAVANEAQLASANGKKVSFFMRKGADILSKWVGESEKQLRVLFDEARRRQPSIIFFDELDGLAPVRHSKQEQSHAALVSTLLALMDGMDDRGQVIIIGATNRPDTIDPALRRPGRFDRELRFPLPDESARRHIVNIHCSKLSVNTAGRSDEKDRIMEYLLGASEGWTGADIQSACTEASLHALRTKLPQIFATSKKLKLPPEALEHVRVTEADISAAVSKLLPSMRRTAQAGEGGMLYVPPLTDHMAILVRCLQRLALRHIERFWAPAAAAAFSAHTRKCEDVRSAILAANSLPLPQVPRGAFFSIGASRNGKSAFAASEVVKSIAKHYSTFSGVHVSLPKLLSGSLQATSLTRGSSSTGFEETTDENDEVKRQGVGTGTSVGTLFASLRAVAPSILYLHDVDSALEMLGVGTIRPVANEEEEVHADFEPVVTALRYELQSALLSCDILVVLPCASPDSIAAFERHVLTEPVAAALRYSRVMCEPMLIGDRVADEDHMCWVKFMWSCARRVFDAAAQPAQSNTQWQELPLDDSPPPPPTPRSRKEEREKQLALWQRVEYKRRQLRRILSQWISQFVSNRRFMLLASADLDLNESSPLWEAWRKHTHGRRIGLEDILEKLENEEYTCLSQYNADIEQLCSNVRTFFTTRSVGDQRYRSRAVELKETTVLNMYKIHRNVARYCEEHKDMVEPIDTDSEGSSSEGVGEEGATVRDAKCEGPHSGNNMPAPAPKKKKSTGWKGNRRRRGGNKSASAAKKSTSPIEGEAAKSKSIDDDKDDVIILSSCGATPMTKDIDGGANNGSASKSGVSPDVLATSMTPTNSSSAATSASRKSSARKGTDDVTVVRSAEETAVELFSSASPGGVGSSANNIEALVSSSQRKASKHQQGGRVSLPSPTATTEERVQWTADHTRSLSFEVLHILSIALLRELTESQWRLWGGAKYPQPQLWEDAFVAMWARNLYNQQ